MNIYAFTLIQNMMVLAGSVGVLIYADGLWPLASLWAGDTRMLHCCSEGKGIMRNTLMSSLCLCLFAGCNILNRPDAPPKPDDKKPDAPVVEYTEQDYWNELAAYVEKDVFLNTDQLCASVDNAVKRGVVKDVSRLVEVRKKRIEPIKGDDKTRIVSILRGK